MTIRMPPWWAMAALAICGVGCNRDVKQDPAPQAREPIEHSDGADMQAAVAQQAPNGATTTPPTVDPEVNASRTSQTGEDVALQIAERDRLWESALRHFDSGDLATAAAAGEQTLSIERQIPGPAGKEAPVLEFLSDLHLAGRDFAKARGFEEELLSMTAQVLGEQHYRTADCRRALRDIDLQSRLTDQQREQLGRAERLQSEANQLAAEGRHEVAVQRMVESAEVLQRVLGEKHLDYAFALDRLAALHNAGGEPQQAESLLLQVSEIAKENLGESHPTHAATLFNLGELYRELSEPEKAEALFRKAAKIFQATQGAGSESHVASLDSLAKLQSQLGDRAAAAGDMDRAKSLYREAFETLRAVDESDADGLAALGKLADLHSNLEEFTQAQAVRREILQIHARQFGPDAYRTANARQSLADTLLLERLAPEQRRQWQHSKQLLLEAATLSGNGRNIEARQLLESEAPILKAVVGDQHPDYADIIRNLAELFRATGENTRALTLFLESKEIFQATLGENHPAYALNLESLAATYDSLGQYQSAAPLYRELLEFRREADDSNVVRTLNDLATLYFRMGEYLQAEPLYREACQSLKAQEGEDSPQYARVLSNLAGLYFTIGDEAQAITLLREVLEAHKKSLGDKAPEYSTDLLNLASIYRSRGERSRAEPLLIQALEIERTTQGEANPHYAACLSSLGRLYCELGECDRAEPLLQRALKVRRTALGETHPDFADSLSDLGLLWYARGDYERAEPYYRQALEIERTALGDSHPAYAQSLNNLGFLHQCLENYGRAEAFYREALEITARRLELTAAGLSERQQLAMAEQERRALDSYCSCAVRAGAYADRAYAYVLDWKGAVLQRQHSARLKRSSDEPQSRALLERLESASTELATVALRFPQPEDRADWAARIDALTNRKESLEIELSRHSADFQRRRAEVHTTPEDLQAVLPTDTALVDMFVYWHSEPTAEGKGQRDHEARVVAFIVRSDRKVQLIPLGNPAQIAADVEAWRDQRGLAYTQGLHHAGLQLRGLVWEPLQPHLEGVKTILVSPDGVTARLPWGALPGDVPGEFLMEERSFAILPVPQMLPSLLRAERPPSGERQAMLLLGGVDFSASSDEPIQLAADQPRSRTAARDANGTLEYQPLPGSAEEVEEIAKLFRVRRGEQSLIRLEGAEATEALFRERAPTCRWLHLATHGYFAPHKFRSVFQREPTQNDLTLEGSMASQNMGGFHPGLLSGIVLAGANRPPQSGRDDGILTALEVEQLDLSNVELAVLSACQTGLGPTAGGEGVLGLQRAFQIAGARSTVTSLWKVDDDATRTLMTEFYRNLWTTPAMSKVEALRLAQLAMLKRYDAQTRQLRPRGINSPQSRPDDRHSPLWAAFVLSGDWR